MRQRVNPLLMVGRHFEFVFTMRTPLIQTDKMGWLKKRNDPFYRPTTKDEAEWLRGSGPIDWKQEREQENIRALIERINELREIQRIKQLKEGK